MADSGCAASRNSRILGPYSSSIGIILWVLPVIFRSGVARADRTGMISSDAAPVLASIDDLMGLLGPLSAPEHRRTLRKRMDQDTARAAISQLFSDHKSSDEPGGRVSAQAAARAAAESVNKKAASQTEREARSSPPGQSVARGRQGRYCQCGACKWCRENARWGRIFQEKFADPTYYGRIEVRYGSALAELG
jgi:hypothetical protein